MRSEKEN